jgi:hypothetical protein
MKILAITLLLMSSFCTAQTTCIENTGKPCPEWLHKLVGQYPPLPDRQESARAATFFTFNKDSHAALKPDKKSWVAFIGSHAALGIAYTIDHKLTHGIRESASSEVPAILGVTGMDFITFKCFSPALSIEAPIYAIQHYTRDIFK